MAVGYDFIIAHPWIWLFLSVIAFLICKHFPDKFGAEDLGMIVHFACMIIFVILAGLTGMSFLSQFLQYMR